MMNSIGQIGPLAVMGSVKAGAVIVGCTMAMPARPSPMPPGETIDLGAMVVEYTPGGVGAPEQLSRVDDATQCGPGKFYVELDTVTVCPDTCSIVHDDSEALLETQFDCVPAP